MSTAIILAGGRSSRSGRIHKGLRTLARGEQQQSWLEYQIDQLRSAGFVRIILATGYRSRMLLAKSRQVVQRHNPDASLGPFSTLQQALKGFIGGPALLVPLDNPVPDAGTLFKVRQALRGRTAAKPCFKGRGGHPLLLNRAMIEQLKAVPLDDENARLDLQLKRLDRDQIGRADVRSAHVLTNLNTQTQWGRYKRSI